MSVHKTKDILSLLQSRIALRANFLSEYAPSGATDWPAVEDQKADKKAVAEIVKLRRELKNVAGFTTEACCHKAAATLGYIVNSKWRCVCNN